MKAKKKRGVEAPLKVAAFIDRVVSTPFSDIEATLVNFTWDFEKGDFYQWVDLFNHFDSYFEQHIESRNDLRLLGQFVQSEAPFPKQGVMQILRVTRVILENCANKHLYSSVEHVSLLLASTDVEVVIGALEVLAAFVKKPFLTRSGRWHGEPSTNAKLFSLSQGWGGKEEGLGLLACASGSGLDHDAQRLGSALHFEFYASNSPAGEGSSSGLKVIHIPDVHMQPEKGLKLLEQIVHQYAVPLSLRFSLLTRLRFACAFTSLENRRQYIRVRLLAFTVLLQSNPDHEDLTAFFVNEPEFVNELVMLLRAEEVVPEEIRSLAILALTAQSQDRPRQSNVLNVIGAGGHRGILPSLMQKTICSLTAGAPGSCSVSFVEALLGLVAALVNTSSGCASLREAGLIPTLLPLLKDSSPQHSHLLSSAVHILETFMDFSNSAAALFRDLGGLDDTIERLKLEVAKAENCITGMVETKEPLLVSVAGVSHTDEVGRDQRLMVEDGDKGKMPMQEDDVGQDDAIGSLSTPTDTIPYSQRLLLKALLRAIALANYAPGSTGRLHGVEESSLPGCLCVIFRHAKVFGGGVFSLAASVMSGLIHHDPTCYPTLDAAGLPRAFLDSIANGVLPSSEAICVIPNALIALCLNNAGLQAVKDRNALNCFVTIFTSKQYQKALSGETPTALGAGLDELMRHVPTLRAAGITMSIDILKTIASIGGGQPNAERSQNVAEILASALVAKDGASSDAPIPMDTDGEDKANVGEIAPQVEGGKAESADQPPSSSVAVADVAGVDVETFLPECIGNTVRFLESMLSNSENSRLFIEQRGLEALLRLYTLPKLPLSFGGSSTAQGMSITFRAFSPQHANHLNREVGLALREWVKVSATLVSKILVGKKLSEISEGQKCTLIRCLAAAESFLGLTAVLVRSSASMMTELAGAGTELFSNICKIYLEVLWQLAILEDSKTELKPEGEVTGTAESRDREDVADITQLMRFMDGWGPGGASGVHVGPEYLPFPLPDAGISLQARQGARAGGVLHRVPRPHPPHAPVGGEGGVVNLTHVGGRQSARVPRHLEVAQADLDGPFSSEPAQSEAVKGKPANVVYQEVMLRLVSAVRMLFVALAKVMVVPSRRRDDVANLTLPAKKIAGSVASVFLKALAFEGKWSGNLPGSSSSESERQLAIKCWFMGKVVGDMGAVLLDNQRRTCNTALLNHFYALGTMKELLTSFEATSQLLWTLPPQCTPGAPMETETGKGGEEKVIVKREIGRPWLNETLRSYSRLLEQVVHAPMLLAPTLNGQLLVQPVAGATVSVPSAPEAFVKQLQSEVLEVVLPIWRHSRFPECNSAFIASITATINNVYTGAGDGRAAVRSAVVRPPEGPPVRPPPPPPDDALISMIVEMGFPRHRAEEALRRVGSNSVELAMEWLFSHPAEEPTGEDDELARALALSMTNVDTVSKEQTFETPKEEKSPNEGDEKNGPPVEEMLETAVHLLEHSEAVAFPLTDLLLTIIGRNKGEDRPRVLRFLAEQLRKNILGDPKSKSYTGVVSTVAHILALVCAEDVSAREMVAKSGLAKFALDFLSTFAEKHDCFVEPGTPVEGQNPKWVTALLLVLDYLLQYKPVSSSSAEDAQAPSSSQGEGIQQERTPVGHPSGHRDSTTSGITAGPNSSPFTVVAMAGSSQPVTVSSEGTVSLDDGDASEHGRPTEAGKLERNEKDWLSDILCKFTGYLSDEEQIRALRLCVDFIKLQLPSTAMQAVLQLCARLTKRHSLALEFFERGGLPALLGLPKDCLFSTFDTVAASIIRHLLEDSQTLQAAMESEVKHTLSYMQGRQGNRTVFVGPFLTAMAPLITRQPVVFMRAAGTVCQLETVNGRTSVVLAKDKEKEREKEKDREKEKEKEKEKDRDKEKVKEKDAKVPAQTSSPIPMTVDNGPAGPGVEGNLKGQEIILASKSGRLKRVPSTFAQVIDQLLEVIMHYPTPGQEVDESQEVEIMTAMEVDEDAPKDSSIVPGNDTKKGKLPEGTGKDEENSQIKTKSSAALTRLTFVMRLMTEILLMYSSSSAVVLRRDTESSQASRTPISDVGGLGGLLHHVFHRLLPYAVERGAERPRIQEDRPLERLGDRAAYFLMALCMRSGEGRRRVVAEMAKALKELSTVLPKDSALGNSPQLQAPNRKVRAFVDLANSLLSHPPAQNGAPTPGVSSDMAQTMIEAGMVQALTETLQSIDLDHPDAPKLVTAILKALEALTRVTPTGEQGVVGIHGSGHRRVNGQAERATGAGQRSTEGMEVRREPTARANHPGGGHPDEHMHDSIAEEAGDGRIRDAGERHGTEDEDRHERDIMEHDQRVEEEEEEARLDHRVRLAVEEVHIYPDSAAEPMFRPELDMVLQFNPIEHAEEEDDGQHDDDEEDMEGDDGDEEGDDLAEDDDDDEELDEDGEDDQEGDEGGQASPPDSDGEDHEDDEHGLGEDYDEEQEAEDDEEDEDDWEDQRMIEVRWRDGLTGMDRVQLLAGGTDIGGMLDFPGGLMQRGPTGDPVYMNIDEVFSTFRRAAGAERRRGNFRGFSQPVRQTQGGGFSHPLLTRPPAGAGDGADAGAVMAPVANPGILGRLDPDEFPGRDMAQLMFYDHPLLAEQMADGLLNQRTFGGGPSQLLDFAEDPMYMMWRTGRMDGRLSNWTDDGLPQSGAYASSIARAIENDFLATIHAIAPASQGGQPVTGNQPVDPPASAGTETRAVQENVAAVSTEMVGGPSSQAEVEANNVSEGRPSVAGSVGSEEPAVGAARAIGEGAGEPVTGERNSTEGGQFGTSAVEGVEGSRQAPPDSDVFMQDNRTERSEFAGRDAEGTSQDSGGSGATVGESLRSLEVEVGSVDGHDESERLTATERIPPSGDTAMHSSGEGSRQGAEGRDRDEEMEGVPSGGTGVSPGEDRAVGLSATAHTAENSRRVLGTSGLPARVPVGGVAPVSAREEHDVIAPERQEIGEVRPQTGTDIDPTFLEALPEDLRAEVLASQQAQVTRATNTQATAPEDMGELDPEFLAALPPDIQVEVLAQQRAQRVLAAHTTAEGQPVDMDSASIIATFPAELREEVLLTSSEAVLAALPPALLAEAQLLRERAMNQYQARGLYAGQRLGGHHRRAHVAGGAGGGSAQAVAGATDPRAASARPRGYSPYQLGSGIGGTGTGTATGVGKGKETEGKPLVDANALKALLRLLRLAQPLGKGLLQRLLLNLCSHSITRASLLQLLLDMLRPEAEGVPVGPTAADGAPPQRLYGCQFNVVYARAQSSDGVPPLVSRRVLEILTYLARHHNQVAHQLLLLERPESTIVAQQGLLSPKAKEKGKAKVVEGSVPSEKTGEKIKEVPLILLLKLLNQPLYYRSSAHLEQVMGLLEVVTRSAGVEAAESRNRLKAAAAARAAEVASAAAAAAANAAAAARAAMPSTVSTSIVTPLTTSIPQQTLQETAQPMQEGNTQDAEVVVGISATPVPVAGSVTDARSLQLDGDEAMGAADPSSEVQILAAGNREKSASGAETAEAQTGREDATPAERTPAGQASQSLTTGAEPESPPLPIALTVLSELPKSELRTLCQLLAREGLSDTAYARVSTVLKLLADAVPPHRQLFIEELADAARQLSGRAIAELQVLGENDALVNTGSMAGAATLRVLQTLSALLSMNGSFKEKAGETAGQEKEEGLAIALELNTALEPLWQGLSACATKFEARLGTSSTFTGATAAQTAAGGAATGAVTPLPPGIQKLLPFVEGFFVLCERMRVSQGEVEVSEEGGRMAVVRSSSVNGTGPSSSSAISTSDSTGSGLFKGPGSGLRGSPLVTEGGGMTLARFAEKHRRLLNAFIRQNHGLLESSFSLQLRTPWLLDFDNKRTYFRSRIRQQHEQPHYGNLRISVRRAYILEDSYNQLRMRTPEELKGRLTVQFQAEEGIDAGGLTREWYLLLSRVIFDKGALLFTTVGNDSTFQPNPNSVLQPEHLSYFKFVGRVVAKALYDGQLLDVHFTRSFYKHILGTKVTYHDIEAIDPDYYKNLKWMLENDISDILDLTFSMDADEEKHILYEKGEVTDYELIPGGRNVRVTEENKEEYVNRVAEYRLTVAIRPQINAFLEGFTELIPRELISIFNDKELELLISGLPEIDIENLRANTEYTGFTVASPVIQWFWEVVKTFSKEDCARLLQFITGTSKVPLEGFRALQGISGPQKFQIHKAYGAPQRLPSAHTCFNQLDFPEYTSKEQLQERLLLAIHEGNEGFGFG